MRYKILKDGETVNTIIADEEFCKAYCEKHGYTFAEDPFPEPEPLEPEPSEPSVWDELQAAYEEGVNSAYDQ